MKNALKIIVDDRYGGAILKIFEHYEEEKRILTFIKEIIQKLIWNRMFIKLIMGIIRNEEMWHI